MEHLSTPNNPCEDSQIEVPYFCRHQYDLHETLFTYPATQGYDRDNFISNLELTPDTIRDFEAFLQEWLYFTFLHEIFRIVGVEINHRDFIRVKQNGRKVVTTANLLAYIEKWLAFSTAASPETNKNCLRAVNECIQEVQVQCERLDRAGLSSTPIILGILILGETIGCARSSIYRHRAYDLWPKCNIPSIYMIHHGWCPNKIAMLEKLYGNASLYYLSLVAQTDGSGRSHHNCTNIVCKTHNINRETYTSAHTTTDCVCEFIGPDERKIATCIDAGGFPVVVFRGDKLEVIQAGAENSPKYTAISHVWSDGLGNLHGNKLPLCQIRKINERVIKLSEGAISRPFWMDTLCVPWENDEENRRRKAIGRMRDTYESATSVLVVSTDFTSVAGTITPAEALLRVATSGWMRRLWTLQEGVLARNLYFEFSDGALNFNSLEIAVNTNFNSTFVPVKVDALQSGHHFQKFKSMQHNKMEELHNALQWRNTSWQDDEPLCLSILLDLDAEKIAGTEGKDRMWTLLSMLPNIPTQLIFAPGSRIAREGFTWAPKSIMHREGYTMALEIDNPTATIGPFGLEMTSPGFLLSPRKVPNKDICFLQIEEANELLTVANLGKHDDGVLWAETGPWNVPSPALIYQSGLFSGLNDAYGALVSILEKKGDALFAKFITRVQIHRETVNMLRNILREAWSKEMKREDITATIKVSGQFSRAQEWVIR